MTPAASVAVGPPRITEAPVAMECREWATLEIGTNRLVVGVGHHIFVRDGLMDPETWKLAEGAYAPLGRMASPDRYCRTGDQFRMPQP